MDRFGSGRITAWRYYPGSRFHSASIIPFGFLVFLLTACDGSSTSTTPLPVCAIGAPVDLTAGPGANVGSSAGYTKITACGDVAENVVLDADLSTGSGNCLNVKADGISIDGNGHTITASGYAVWVQGYSHVDIRNLSSTSGIYLYGNDTNACTIENCTLDSILVREGDDHNILNNQLASFVMLVDVGSDPALRLTFKGNFVRSNMTDPVAFYGSRNPPCPETNFLIEENIFQNDMGASDVPNVMRMGCSRKNIVRKNLIKGTDEAVGWYLRDDISDTLFEENTLWTNKGEALRIAAGNTDKDFPSRNVFRNNVFRSDAGYSSFIQATPISTTFEKNVFWGTTAWLTGGAGNTFDRNTFVGRGGSAAVLVYRDTPTDTFMSNIFYGGGPDLFNFVDGFGFDRYTGDYNVFFQSSGPVNFKGTGTLADWQSASVSAGIPADQHSTEADPTFADTSGGDFRLLKTSTILGLGKDSGDPGAFPSDCSP